jgi:hypothetical protein
MKKVLKYVVMAMLFMAMVMAIPVKAEAYNVKKSIAKTGISFMDKRIMYAGEIKNLYGEMFMTLNGLSDVTVSSSNTSVCNAQYVYLESSGKNVIRLEFNNTGKATIKVTYKYKGKKYKSRARIKVVNYKNPLKSFKIGGKEYKTIFDAENSQLSYSCPFGYAKVSGKKTIVGKLKSGYKFYRGYYQMKKNSKLVFNYSPKKKANLSKVGYFTFEYKDKEGYEGHVVWCNRNMYD